ncbi:hypothetical protein UFOVP355_28 [uncultured Caudovirales phage]|uniref:DUF3846 domain-containing protein n=1 Tax=uncultured Caudovirales phage TaxID=2100421 RepID=A0A6J5NHB3_9CAUD|nr:hypothetical protein UFOVP355_28 [uncultured Caudovirales phage]CAB4156901.1 hypothetical protein UFOVP677_28 [uncultured Caudovirales phage]
MSAVHGLLIHSGVGAKVERIQVGELEDIQSRVGGMIDAVRKQVSKDIVAVGYVHDEGLILDMEMNWIASALFMQEIRGPVVVVNGLSKDYEYDGDNHDLPDAFITYMQTKFIDKVAETYNESKLVQGMLEYAFNKDMITEDETKKLLEHLELGVEGNEESMDYVNNEFARIYELIEQEMTVGATDQLVDEIYDYLKKQGG